MFDGGIEHTSTQIKKLLQIGAPPANKNTFVVPLSTVDAHLTTLLKELTSDPKPTKPDARALRATGPALAVALSVLEGTFQHSGARVLMFCGGPATHGPGLVLGVPHTEQMRSHTELEKEQAPYVHKACKYYSNLADMAVKNGHAVEVFSCSLNQTGVLEMQETFKQTGGCVILSESFEHKMFTESLKSLFSRDAKNFLKMGFGARIEVRASKELAISGGIGHFVSAGNKSGNISKVEVGIGGTCEWKTSVMDQNSAFAFYFEVDNPKETPMQEGKYGKRCSVARLLHIIGSHSTLRPRVYLMDLIKKLVLLLLPNKLSIKLPLTKSTSQDG